MSNPVILITGASSGIGLETAKLFAARGWSVAATMRKPMACRELDGVPGIWKYALDVCEPSSIRTAVAAVIKDYGRIDVLLNNAGYGAFGCFENATNEAVRRQLETNVFGLMAMTRAVLPTMREQKSGTIVNISSVAGKLTFPGYSLYHTSKFAVEGFSEALTHELRSFGIKVRLVEPGPIKTDFYTRSKDWLVREDLDVYDAYQERVFENIRKSGSGAMGPEVVAKVIWKAAQNKGGKLRWPAGPQAHGLMFLRKILPDSVLMGLIRMAVKG